MRYARPIKDIALIAVTAGLLCASIALSHGASEYYNLRWKAGERFQVYEYQTLVPSGNFRERIRNGAQAWNSLPPEVHFTDGSVNLNVSHGQCDANRQAGENGVYYAGIDGKDGVLANTAYCVWESEPTKLYAFSIKFDNAENWYSGTGTPGGSQYDTHGVAAHEFGHATGFTTHWAVGPPLCNADSKKHTMCPAIGTGSTIWRSLEEHDVHTFENAYN